jgi:hypothetical protein
MSEYKSDYDRLLATALREYERKVRSLMLPKLVAVLAAAQPGDEVPFIGDKIQSPKYDDYQEYRDGLPERVIRAVIAQKWFEFEAPLWAQPLLLKREECTAVFSSFDEPPLGRRNLVARYSLDLRSSGWDIKWAQPFEQFCAGIMRPHC